MKAISAAVSSFGANEIAIIESEGAYTLDIAGEILNLEAEDFIIQSDDIEGWLVASDKGLTVALDIQLSEELEAEGNAREFVNKVQNLRKDNDFEVTDKILVKLLINEEFNPAIEKFKNYICTEVLATDIELVKDLEEATPIEVNEIQLKVALLKV
jgi:isoleucyl-tRNA synthetase